MQVSKTDLKIYQNSDFNAIINVIKSYTNRAYFVGGFVRDFLLFGNETADIDIEIYDITPDKFDEIMGALGTNGVGKSYFVYKFKNFDLSLPRTESKTGIGHKAFDVATTQDEKTAAARRDFTINSIMINVFNGEICDFYGGINDLKSRILRAVNAKTFKEDSLRIYRAVQFCARFDLYVDEVSLALMREIDPDDLSIDRVKCEMMKFFGAKFHVRGMELMQSLGLYERIFGVKISPSEHEKLVKFIDNGKNFVQSEMFFLYAFLNFLGLDKVKILRDLGLHVVYKRVISEPFYAETSDEILCEIALKIPLCEWLGLYSEKRINRARELGIYDKKFQSNVKSEDVLKDGFVGAQIAGEILRRQKSEISAFLRNLKA